MSAFDEWYRNEYTLEERMTDPSHKGERRIAWNAALLHAAEVAYHYEPPKSVGQRCGSHGRAAGQAIAARLREEIITEERK